MSGFQNLYSENRRLHGNRRSWSECESAARRLNLTHAVCPCRLWMVTMDLCTQLPTVRRTAQALVQDDCLLKALERESSNGLSLCTLPHALRAFCYWRCNVVV